MTAVPREKLLEAVEALNRFGGNETRAAAHLKPSPAPKPAEQKS